MMKSILVMSILGGSLLISTQALAESDASVMAKACRDAAIKGEIKGKGYGPFMKACTANGGPGIVEGDQSTDTSNDPFQES